MPTGSIPPLKGHMPIASNCVAPRPPHSAVLGVWSSAPSPSSRRCAALWWVLFPARKTLNERRKIWSFSHLSRLSESALTRSKAIKSIDSAIERPNKRTWASSSYWKQLASTPVLQEELLPLPALASLSHPMPSGGGTTNTKTYLDSATQTLI